MFLCAGVYECNDVAHRIDLGAMLDEYIILSASRWSVWLPEDFRVLVYLRFPAQEGHNY